MSLINQMLNELQQNKQNTPVMDGLMPLADSEPKTKIYWLLILLVLLISATLVLKWPDQNRSNIKDKTNMFDKKIESENINRKTVQSEGIQISDQQDVVIPTLDFQTPLEPESKTETKNPLSNKTNSVVEEKKLAENSITQKIVSQPDGLKSNNQSTPTKTSNKVKQTSRISTAEKQLARLIKHWQLSSPQISHQKLIALLDSYPDLPGIWLDSLAFVKSKNSRYYERLLAHSIKTFTELNSFSFLAAQHYFSIAQYSKAKQQLDLIEENKKDKRIYQLAGLVLQKLGKHQQAIDNYKKLLTIVPDKGEINMAIGISFDALNQPKKAASYFALALMDKQLNPIQKQFVKQRLIAYQG